MKELQRIFKTFFAYLQRPDLYPELVRKIKKNTLQRSNATKGKEDSIQWAQSQAISTEEFITNVLEYPDYQTFSELFPEDFEYAKQEEQNCKVKMGGAGNMDLLYYTAQKVAAKNAIETGVAYGWSSMALLESLVQRDGTLYSSDLPYLSQNGDSAVGCVVPEKLRQNWKLFRFADRESVPKILEQIQEFEIMHYDSDKSYNGMMWAYKTLFPHLKEGGYFISDDINDNSAFKDFCEHYGLQPYIIDFEGKYIGIVKK